MYVNSDKLLVYLAHPRTASCATAEALKKRGFKAVSGNHHHKLYEAGSPVNADNRDEWTVFTAVRNHYDAICSWMSSQGSLPKDPSGWTGAEIKDRLKLNRYIGPNSLWSFHPDVDITVRYHNLQDHVDGVLEGAGIESVKIPRVNVTVRRGGTSYRDLLSADGMEYIGMRFGREMESYGYEW